MVICLLLFVFLLFVFQITAKIRHGVTANDHGYCQAVVIAIEIFINIYVEVDPQHPIKRVIARCGIQEFLRM